MNEAISTYLSHIKLPAPDSHKGQNGKLLIIGGSELFHAASKWSLDIASKFVDMVFYSSVPTNNELVKTAKGEFWNGIVVQREDLESYLEEADCILIGPGMTREAETEKLTNSLVKKYTHKKWVIDAGALQMIDPKLLNQNMIVTPHQQEFEVLIEKSDPSAAKTLITLDQVVMFSQAHQNVCVIVKGPEDIVVQAQSTQQIQGGNAGMTKGGTGDVLAGLVAALYCTHDVFTSAVVGSYINKRAGDSLHEKVGPYFNASDLVNEIPTVFWLALKEKHAKKN